jgi:putative ABC transport system permease protein
MRGTLRWARADLRAHRGQSVLTVAVVAGVVAALVLAAMLLEGALNPWQELYSRTNGADMLVYLSESARAAKLHGLPGVETAAAPYQEAPATLTQGAEKEQAQIDGMPLAPPAMSAPLVVAGTWLRAGSPDGVVVEASFAAATHMSVGSALSVTGVDGYTARMRVIGIADTADQGFYPQWQPGLIWARPGLLARVEPAASERSEVVGLRLSDPSAAGIAQVSQEVFDAYNATDESSPVQRITDRRQVMDSMASDDRLLGLLLALLGVIALIAAPCAIANVVSGRVLMQRREIAMLKAIGFTPGQVTAMLLAEQTALGVIGTGLGVATATIATLPEFVRPPAGVPVTLASLPGAWTALIAAGTVACVAVAAGVPAWRAGRVTPVAAVQPSPPGGHLSRIARLSLLVRLPAALVVGARDALTRRLPALLTVAGVAVPMAMITIALGCWSTIGGFTSDPAHIGMAGALDVYPGGLSVAAAHSVIAADPQVSASYPAAEFDTPLPGDNGTFVARAMGTSASPYPFQVVDGRMFRTPDEAVAGQGFLDLMHVRVGELVDPTIDGVPVILRIVGRTIEPDDNGDVLDFGLDALRAAGAPSSPTFYSVVLKPGVAPSAARARLLAASGNRLDVREVANPASELGVMRVVIVVAVILLAMIAIANLLTATDIGLRDHAHEAGILQAMGFTPRQVMASLVVSMTIATAAGIVAGTAAGLAVAPRLINAQGKASGMGWGIATNLSPAGIAVLVTVSLAAAVAAAFALARRATGPVPAGSTPAQPARMRN